MNFESLESNSRFERTPPDKIVELQKIETKLYNLTMDLKKREASSALNEAEILRGKIDYFLNGKNPMPKWEDVEEIKKAFDDLESKEQK